MMSKLNFHQDFLIILILLSKYDSMIATPVSICPNSCYNQGICTTYDGSKALCKCFPGFIGVDCSLRVCPSAPAWFDYPFMNNTAHADFTECANMVT